MITNATTVGVIFAGVWILLTLPAGVCLILCQQKTRMSGFIWLFTSVVVWPLVAGSITFAVNLFGPAMVAREGWTAAEYLNVVLLLSLAETMVGGMLLFASCLVLYRQIVHRTAPTAPLPPAVAVGVLDERG
jgi:hypothetical protein